jgi:hypothetical protein
MNFAMNRTVIWGPVLFIPTTVIALLVSSYVSDMSLRQWYHEIVLCGVNKVAMSITDLSEPETNQRRPWMIVFEAYFGLMIKFVNPAILIFILMSNLADDFDQSYGNQPLIMHVFSSVFIFTAFSIIIIPMFMCDKPEIFQHNVMQEFNADDRFELRLKFKQMLKGKNIKFEKGKAILTK